MSNIESGYGFKAMALETWTHQLPGNGIDVKEHYGEQDADFNQTK